MRCSFIKAGGGRCKRTAMESYSYCYSHRPDLAEQRHQDAARGGRAGGNGRPSGLSETSEAKGWTRDLIAELRAGEVSRETAVAAFTGINTLARLIELENKIKLTDEIEERLAAIEAEDSAVGEATSGATNTVRSGPWGQ